MLKGSVSNLNAMALQTFARQDPRVARVVSLVARDLTVRVTRTEGARLASLEATYFSKQFRRVTGSTYKAWNVQIRIDAAKRLLATTNLKVSAVGAAVGYDDVTTFERNFRRCSGVSPSAFRAATNSGRR
jgi:AraC-like DNA-binding protein